MTTTFLHEAMAATRGCFALLTGRRDAPSYFDFSQRGLVGSLIAVVIAIALAGFAPMFFGVAMPAGAATHSVILNVALFAAQAGAAYLALRQMGRQDGFVPFMVTYNWITLISALLMLLSSLMGPAGLALLILVTVMVIAGFINIGRLVVTLTGLQIGLLFVAQTVGVCVAIIVVGTLFGAPVLQ